MTIKAQIKNILLKNFQYINCDNCKYQDTDNCDECHRKYINWSLSPEVAEDITEEIITEIIFEEKEEEKYEHCDSYTLNYDEPQCLSTKRNGIL